MNDQKNNSLSNLIAGIVIGAAVTYLFGTRDGRKLKDKLVKESAKILESLKEGLENIQEEPQDKEKVARKLEETQQVAETEAPPHIEALQKKGRRFFFKRSSPRTES